MSQTFSGGCSCGAVRFAAHAPSLWCAHCHCSMCRRAHGAAFVTWVGLAEERSRIDDRRGALRWHASSPGAERGFCSACGSPTFFRSQRWPGELHVPLAHFDTPIDRQPQLHVFWNTHAPWFPFQDDLPRKP
ncbi:MAG TPA: GFA family protein [Thermoanaerobaculia bacterium]|nr:GFA family protein [Thermoanaerobaculia bacterium]